MATDDEGNEISDPLDHTILDAIEDFNKLYKKHGNKMHGIIICIKYDNDYDEDDSKGMHAYYTGGGLTILETAGLLSTTEYIVLNNHLNKKEL